MGAEKLNTSNPLLDKKLITAFIDGVLKTVALMANTQATTEKPYVATNHRPDSDIAGIIGMIASGMKGSLTIRFQKQTVFKILENMLGEIHTEVNDDVIDVVGELTNQIYGSAKTTLNELGYGFEMAIPSVTTGPSVTVGSTATLVIPFAIDPDCKFFVEITIQS